MALIKKFRIKNLKGDDPIIELKNISVFYNKREITRNTWHVRSKRRWEVDNL